MNKIVVKWRYEENKRFDSNGNVHHSFNEKTMRVLKSNHPRFSDGTRFDFGFLEIASGEGYVIEILP